ncbi:transcriptional regulator [Bacillus sp. NP157]|nr:transcriptional regulator [Bacillus sp. NP157]
MNDAFVFGSFRLIPQERSLSCEGAEVPLGSRAFDLLVALVEHPGSVVTPREMMRAAWPGLIVVDSNIRVQIANLRRALGDMRVGERYIATVAGRGYCFVADVDRLPGQAPTQASVRLRDGGQGISGPRALDPV